MARFRGWIVTKYLCLCTSFVLLTFVCTFSNALVNDGNQPSEEAVQRGKEAYSRALRESKSKVPKYSSCWKNALQNLDEGCRRLTDEIQHELALAFLNCFLLSTGKDDLICRHSNYIKCTKNFDNSLVQLHNDYFIHTQNMCSFLQLQIWHDRTEDTISRLASASSDTAKRLMESSELQEKMLNSQGEALKNQDKILKSGDQLGKVLETSANGVKTIFDEYKRTTQEQRLLITDVFDRVSSLQSIVLGEFTSLYSIIFYVLSISISYLVTSTPRTGGARFWLFLLMTVNIVLERMIVSWSGLDPHVNIGDANSILYQRLWLCRKIFWLAGLVLIAKVGYSFKDLNKINNQHLVEIRKQISEIRRSVDSGMAVGLPYRPESNCLVSTKKDLVLLSKKDTCQEIEMIKQGILPTPDSSHTSICYPGSVESSGDSSFDSDSDRTYIQPDQDSDEESFMTVSGPSSRASTPTSLLDELRDLCQATPLKNFSPSVWLSGTPLTPASEEKGNSRTSGKRKGRRASDMNDRPGLERYNLRRRSQPIPMPNPILGTESPRSFARKIKTLAEGRLDEALNQTYSIVERRNSSCFSDTDS